MKSNVFANYKKEIDQRDFSNPETRALVSGLVSCCENIMNSIQIDYPSIKKLDAVENLGPGNYLLLNLLDDFAIDTKMGRFHKLDVFVKVIKDLSSRECVGRLTAEVEFTHYSSVKIKHLYFVNNQDNFKKIYLVRDGITLEKRNCNISDLFI